MKRLKLRASEIVDRASALVGTSIHTCLGYIHGAANIYNIDPKSSVVSSLHALSRLKPRLLNHIRGMELGEQARRHLSTSMRELQLARKPFAVEASSANSLAEAILRLKRAKDALELLRGCLQAMIAAEGVLKPDESHRLVGISRRKGRSQIWRRRRYRVSRGADAASCDRTRQDSSP